MSDTSGASPAKTLDELFRDALARRPDAVALIDPPDRNSWNDIPPRRLTYAEADRAVTAVARRFRDSGLSRDTVVAMQLPNCVDSIVTLLGLMRAGLIAAPLPLLWRQADAVDALSRIGPRALISTARVGGTDQASIAMYIAAETFSIRFVGEFGRDLPDGIISLNDIFNNDAETWREPPLPADRVSLVTFDLVPEGRVAMARNDAQLVAAGRHVCDASQLDPRDTLLGAISLSCFAGIASTIVPWLLCAGTLMLHHPFSPDVFAPQCKRSDAVILPGPLAAGLAEATAGTGERGPKSWLGVWRTPERLAKAGAPPRGARVFDFAVFGEIALMHLPRPLEGHPLIVPSAGGPLTASRTDRGTLALAGDMVSSTPFPANFRARDGSQQGIEETGTVDTFYPCRIDRETKGLILDGPPAGIVTIGGTRLLMRDLQDGIARFGTSATITALPDALLGHRLAATGPDRSLIREALAASGVNPLIPAAFRERRQPNSATAA